MTKHKAAVHYCFIGVRLISSTKHSIVRATAAVTVAAIIARLGPITHFDAATTATAAIAKISVQFTFP